MSYMWFMIASPNMTQKKERFSTFSTGNTQANIIQLSEIAQNLSELRSMCYFVCAAAAISISTVVFVFLSAQGLGTLQFCYTNLRIKQRSSL